jgi:hypothetical protein
MAELDVSTRDLRTQYHVELPLKMPYDHPRRRYVLSVVMVRIAEHFNQSALNVSNVILLVVFTSSHTAVILYRKLP